MVGGATTQEGLPFEPLGVVISAVAVGNLLAGTSRELGLSIECRLLVGDACKVSVILKAELLSL